MGIPHEIIGLVWNQCLQDYKLVFGYILMGHQDYKLGQQGYKLASHWYQTKSLWLSGKNHNPASESKLIWAMDAHLNTYPVKESGDRSFFFLVFGHYVTFKHPLDGL
jgi:hypothetical protein